MLGGLLHYLTTAAPAAFQPINANFGLVPVLPQLVRDRRERNRLLAARAQADFQAWRRDIGSRSK
jgi:methylenetetrahydrofolate--tRNA-(uracil-5-)-methyltransferase